LKDGATGESLASPLILSDEELAVEKVTLTTTGKAIEFAVSGGVVDGEDGVVNEPMQWVVTRAKRTLAIHTNGNLFDSLKSAQHLYDAQAYDEPNEIVLQLSHKDVNLGFSKPHKDAILCLRSGMPLTYHDHCLCLPSTGRDIAQLSIKMKEKLGKWELKGYKVTAARIRFIVAWKSKDAPRDEKESAIVLADLVMEK
jgi:hypothetical protein